MWLSELCSLDISPPAGGSATLMIGNGDSSRENGTPPSTFHPLHCKRASLWHGSGFDNLSSTVAAAEAVGFEMRGWATIESCADETHRRRIIHVFNIYYIYIL